MFLERGVLYEDLHLAGKCNYEIIVQLSIQVGICKMLNLKQVTLDLEVTCGKDLRACLSMQNIQAVMIKDAKKVESWWRKWYSIEIVTWIPRKIF